MPLNLEKLRNSSGFVYACVDIRKDNGWLEGIRLHNSIRSAFIRMIEIVDPFNLAVNYRYYRIIRYTGCLEFKGYIHFKRAYVLSERERPTGMQYPETFYGG
jgi:hypothetical protein